MVGAAGRAARGAALSGPPRPRGRRYLDDVGPLVDAIPPGRALAYGDVAALTGWGAARAVGAVMSRHGHELPWWRVVRADGSLPEGLLARARLHWQEESTPLLRGGDRVDLAAARWDPPAALAPGRGAPVDDGPRRGGSPGDGAVEDGPVDDRPGLSGVAGTVGP